MVFPGRELIRAHGPRDAVPKPAGLSVAPVTIIVPVPPGGVDLQIGLWIRKSQRPEDLTDYPQ
jgi:hypothetical protein